MKNDLMIVQVRESPLPQLNIHITVPQIRALNTNDDCISLFLNVERCTIKHQVRSFTSSFLDRSTVLPSMLCPILFVHICM